MEASDFIAEEFRAVAPAAPGPGRSTRVTRVTMVTGLVSSAGSALAVWCWEDGDGAEGGRAEVQICLGATCPATGPNRFRKDVSLFE